jgi:hypothetical protein
MTLAELAKFLSGRLERHPDWADLHVAIMNDGSESEVVDGKLVLHSADTEFDEWLELS